MKVDLAAGWVETELGALHVACSARGVCHVSLQPEDAEARFDRWRRTHQPSSPCAAASEPSPSATLFQRAARELRQFATGERRTFDVPVDLVGTDFQRSVWHELMRIPYGATRTYAQVARSIGKPGASRAVGMANNRNTVPILVPCHRVVAADGLGGFGGGLEMKRRLLAVEGALLPFG